MSGVSQGQIFPMVNDRKKRWWGKVTGWFVSRYGQISLRVVLDREPGRRVSVSLDAAAARELVADLVERGDFPGPGVFDGELDAEAQWCKFRVLSGLGVPEATARELAGVESAG